MPFVVRLMMMATTQIAVGKTLREKEQICLLDAYRLHQEWLAIEPG